MKNTIEESAERTAAADYGVVPSASAHVTMRPWPLAKTMQVMKRLLPLARDAIPTGECSHEVLSGAWEALTVPEQMDAAAAARLLRDRNGSRLLVMDRDRQKVIGILLPRDIVIAVVAREADPRTLRVGDMMTRLNVPLTLQDACEAADVA